MAIYHIGLQVFSHGVRALSPVVVWKAMRVTEWKPLQCEYKSTLCEETVWTAHCECGCERNCLALANTRIVYLRLQYIAKVCALLNIGINMAANIVVYEILMRIWRKIQSLPKPKKHFNLIFFYVNNCFGCPGGLFSERSQRPMETAALRINIFNFALKNSILKWKEKIGDHAIELRSRENFMHNRCNCFFFNCVMSIEYCPRLLYFDLYHILLFIHIVS